MVVVAGMSAGAVVGGAVVVIVGAVVGGVVVGGAVVLGDGVVVDGRSTGLLRYSDSWCRKLVDVVPGDDVARFGAPTPVAAPHSTASTPEAIANASGTAASRRRAARETVASRHEPEVTDTSSEYAAARPHG